MTFFELIELYVIELHVIEKIHKVRFINFKVFEGFFSKFSLIYLYQHISIFRLYITYFQMQFRRYEHRKASSDAEDKKCRG